MSKTPQPETRHVRGLITSSETGVPVGGLLVRAMDADFLFDDVLGEGTTDSEGRYDIGYGVEDFRDVFERAPDIYLVIEGADGKIIVDTRDAVVREAGRDREINVQVPIDAGAAGPVIDVGGIEADRRAFEKLDAETMLRIAAAATQGIDDEKLAEQLVELSPQLDVAELERQMCFRPLTSFLRDSIRAKGWPRDIRLRLEDILIGYDPDAAYASYSCPNFTISYQTSGTDQPLAGDAGGNITMPGTGTVVGTTTGGNGVPDYIEKLCFWLENALATYTNPPFSLRDPSATGKIPVNVTGTSAGSAGGGSMTIGRNLNDDLLAAVPTHELMHLIQDLYESSGTAGGWNPGMSEGGAVMGEDVVFDTHNRYIVQATTGGTLANPGTSLNSYGMRYYLALLIKYISEQQSARVTGSDEPAIGVETYRKLLEEFDAAGYGDVAFETAIGDLPWYQHLFRHQYLDAARLDETNSETLLGNFWLACYLKDFGTGSPDRRFDFMEDEDNATWDTIFLGADTVSTLGALSLTSTTTLNSGGSLTLSSGGGNVSAFAARLYRVDVAAAVDTLRVNFTAGSGFDPPLVQLVLVEPGNVVRDIIRSDRTTWARTIASLRGSTRLDHVLVLVAGTSAGGSFTLTVTDAADAPDVMVTKWHHALGTSFEIDPFGWAWTWTSPDVFVDNDGNGNADSEVFFNQNNKLFIRLHNQGRSDASGIGVAFWYQDASGGLHPGAWLPVQNAAGVTQSLSGKNLAAGATDRWSVDWAPVPSGSSKHFCVRAVVTVPGDPNTDNKRVLSNFGNVITASPYIDLAILEHIDFLKRDVRLEVIPRTKGRWFVSTADLREANSVHRGEAGEVLHEFRLRHRRELELLDPAEIGGAEIDPEFKARRLCTGHMTRAVLHPDPLGHYPTDPRALPPGTDPESLITIAQVVDGKVTGGFTWAIREMKEG